MSCCEWLTEEPVAGKSHGGFCEDRDEFIFLSITRRTCEKCNTIHDRDVNASINILNAYKNMFPIGHDRPTRTKKNSS